MKNLYYNDRVQFITALEKLATNLTIDLVVDDIIFVEELIIIRINQ
jgi:hypothetical protein